MRPGRPRVGWPAPAAPSGRPAALTCGVSPGADVRLLLPPSALSPLGLCLDAATSSQVRRYLAPRLSLTLLVYSPFPECQWGGHRTGMECPASVGRRVGSGLSSQASASVSLSSPYPLGCTHTRGPGPLENFIHVVTGSRAWSRPAGKQRVSRAGGEGA